MAFEIREIKFNSPEYQSELALRERVLRTPLGLTLSSGDQELDSTDTHFGAFDGDKLVGCCLLRLSGTAAKMRQVAVDPGAQGRGVGRVLVNYFETEARKRGAREIVLDARETAVSFYQALGYQVTSELFTAVTVPHKKMRKVLDQN